MDSNSPSDWESISQLLASADNTDNEMGLRDDGMALLSSMSPDDDMADFILYELFEEECPDPQSLSDDSGSQNDEESHPTKTLAPIYPPPQCQSWKLCRHCHGWIAIPFLLSKSNNTVDGASFQSSFGAVPTESLEKPVCTCKPKAKNASKKGMHYKKKLKCVSQAEPSSPQSTEAAIQDKDR